MLSLSSQMSVLVLLLLCAVTFNRSFCCHDRDRTLLLIFKQGVVDPSNRLSSWSSTNQHCCEWQGVICDPYTSRVQQLDLQNYNYMESGSESLKGEINLSSLLALEFLEELDLSRNDFERINTPSINTSVVSRTLLPANISLLHHLDLSQNMHNLRVDNLHYWLSQLPSLTYLDLSGIHLPCEMKWVQSLALLPLEALYLRDCNLTSSILSMAHANFSSLLYVDLSLNDFTYGLPNWLFNLSNDLSNLQLGHCSLRGPFPDLSGYRKLQNLDLSSNKLKGSIPDWLGQRDGLIGLDLSNNSFQSSIPSNLLNASSLAILNISFNDLSGTLPKNLDLDQRHFEILDLSHNSISGDISNMLLDGGYILMSFNKFKGRLPRISEHVIALELAHNSFSGSLSSLLCDPDPRNKYMLVYLDISNNYLVEELPECWSSWASLSYIYLGNNQMVGQVPPRMGSSFSHLRALDLQNNGFSGHVPSTFCHCTSLVFINLEGNNFSGNIPSWPQNISVVKLRSNQFTGTFPPQLCSLSALIVLDLAKNKLSGSIPHCLLNITLMISGRFLENALSKQDQLVSTGFPSPQEFKIYLQTKGQQLQYDKNLKLVRSIDLSMNKFTGEIPIQLFKLTQLQSLNLSYNYLTGEIPEQIGEMKDLESLDLSHNNLHGNIPQSMSGLSFLSVLNLSYNHFSGRIPLGTQLQGFDAWSYVGNLELCGAPLPNNCTVPEKLDNTKQVKGNDDDGFLRSLYLGMGVGFAVGFWIVCGSLFLNRTWRHTYFRFIYGVVDRIYVFVAIKLQKFH